MSYRGLLNRPASLQRALVLKSFFLSPFWPSFTPWIDHREVHIVAFDGEINILSDLQFFSIFENKYLQWGLYVAVDLIRNLPAAVLVRSTATYNPHWRYFFSIF